MAASYENAVRIYLLLLSTNATAVARYEKVRQRSDKAAAKLQGHALAFTVRFKSFPFASVHTVILYRYKCKCVCRHLYAH